MKIANYVFLKIGFTKKIAGRRGARSTAIPFFQEAGAPHFLCKNSKMSNENKKSNICKKKFIPLTHSTFLQLFLELFQLAEFRHS